MDKEIIINQEKIMAAETKLKKLQSSLGNRGVSVSLSVSKGDSVIALIELAKKMDEAKNKLAALYGNTASVLAATRASFDKTDNSVANYFNKFWERTDEK